MTRQRVSLPQEQPMSQDSRAPEWTRRQVLEALGLGAIAATLPASAVAAAPTFPKGAIIRTILKDYAPEELAGGATLFHEHLSFADDFMTRRVGDAAATRAANGPPPGAPARTLAFPRRFHAAGGGVSRGDARGHRPPPARSRRRRPRRCGRRTRDAAAAVRTVLHAGSRSDDRGIDRRQGRGDRLHRRR